MIEINNGWKDFLQKEFEQTYFQKLKSFLKEEYQNHTIYPASHDIFKAFEITSLEDVKVVILGQDPYYNPNKAMGLAFSVKDEVKPPPSLANIFKEIENELGIKTLQSGNLTRWAEQGVFLLNTVLTVRENEPNSHYGKGWGKFVDHVMMKLDEDENPKVFMLWGRNAQQYKNFINNPLSLILETSHPSPFSMYRGFMGCGHFKKANEYLNKCGYAPIDWK